MWKNGTTAAETISDESAIPTLEPSVHCCVAQYAHSIMLAVGVSNLLRLNIIIETY